MKQVFVGISGGVDSAAAAYLLKQEGYHVTGYTMTLQGTPIKYDDAYSTAESLGIELITVDVSDEFRELVLKRFVDEYKAGLTPSPCPVCNPIKFGVAEKLLAEADGFIATGHYAVVRRGHLYCAPHEKDQAYFLARLKKRTIQRLILPLGEISKNEVRAITAEAGLDVAEKQDSQDICFIQGDDYRSFLEANGVMEAPGDVVDQNGMIIDRHQGVFHYTIGQRYRLGGTADRIYVTDIDPLKRLVVTGPNEALYSRELSLGDINELARFDNGGELYIKIRSVDSFHPVKSVKAKEGGLEICLAEKVRAVTPGQMGVIYKKTENGMLVCASGWIEKGEQ